MFLKTVNTSAKLFIIQIYVLVHMYILMDLGDVLHLYMNFAKSFCIFYSFLCVSDFDER